MKFLSRATATIRRTDPRGRPIIAYAPNHYDARALAFLAPHLDLIGKGSYVNNVGRQRERVWIRWSIEQELECLRATNSSAIPGSTGSIFSDR